MAPFTITMRATFDAVFEPMLTAFSNILNLDLGRLIGGVLADWHADQCERYGVEL